MARFRLLFDFFFSFRRPKNPGISNLLSLVLLLTSDFNLRIVLCSVVKNLKSPVLSQLSAGGNKVLCLPVLVNCG